MAWGPERWITLRMLATRSSTGTRALFNQLGTPTTMTDEGADKIMAGTATPRSGPSVAAISGSNSWLCHPIIGV
jgi:hypothetical protein